MLPEGSPTDLKVGTGPTNPHQFKYVRVLCVCVCATLALMISASFSSIVPLPRIPGAPFTNMD